MYARPPRYVDGLPRPGRCLVMGVVNVTPDSFSDGGRYLDPDAAVEHGRELVAEGADLVDVGGESTRPGARPAAGRGGARPGAARSWRRSPPRGAGLGRHDARRGGRGRRRRGRGAGQRRLRRAGRPRDAADWSPAAGRLRPDALAGALRRRCSSTPSTTTWSPTWSTSCGAQLEAAARGRHRAGPDRGGPRASASPRPPTRTGRCSPARSGCTTSATRCWSRPSRKRFLGRLLADADGELRPPDARGRHDGDVGAGGGRGRLVRARPRRARRRRRGPGGARWAGDAAGRRGLQRAAEPRPRWSAANAAFYDAVRDRRPRRDADLWLDDPERAVRPPGCAAGPRHRGDRPVLGADDGEHAVHPVLPHRRRGERARRRAVGDLHRERPHRRREHRTGRVRRRQGASRPTCSCAQADGWRLWIHHASPVVSGGR